MTEVNSVLIWLFCKEQDGIFLHLSLLNYSMRMMVIPSSLGIEKINKYKAQVLY